VNWTFGPVLNGSGSNRTHPMIAMLNALFIWQHLTCHTKFCTSITVVTIAAVTRIRSEMLMSRFGQLSQALWHFSMSLCTWAMLPSRLMPSLLIIALTASDRSIIGAWLRLPLVINHLNEPQPRSQCCFTPSLPPFSSSVVPSLPSLHVLLRLPPHNVTYAHPKTMITLC
jgi:hypothetical protein